MCAYKCVRIVMCSSPESRSTRHWVRGGCVIVIIIIDKSARSTNNCNQLLRVGRVKEVSRNPHREAEDGRRKTEDVGGGETVATDVALSLALLIAATAAAPTQNAL